MKGTTLLFTLYLLVGSLSAQSKKPKTPQAHTPQPIQADRSPTVRPKSAPHNQAPAGNTPNRPAPINRGSSPDMEEIQRDLKEVDETQVRYELPDLSSKAGTEHYRNALNEITTMLTDGAPLSIKRATFLTENAFYGDVKKYDLFCSDIDNQIEVIKQGIRQAGYDENNDNAKKWMLYRYMADTIQLKDGNGKITYKHLPFKYDFEDIEGKQDWRKMFVTKLMSTHKGQCHSMPLLYLIMAEELSIDAWLAYSPSHSYIKLKDQNNTWFNLELTNGHYSSDTWLMASGYVKAEAMRNQIYLDTLSKRELVAASLVDLAKGYIAKYGYDPFILECVNKALQYHPNNIYALQIKSDYHTFLFKYVLKQLNYPPSSRIQEYPQAFELFKKYKEMYRIIDGLGYEPMPEDVYKRWLKSFNEQIAKQPKEIIRP
jgi:hypothetical protein